ncbi:hypothetical protein UFOVP2_14 [uncultured Caudovirales phage]|uniref:Uncharacterized protein n=1 Tax=uncultured Caudovirales phage TaxID=2100421 RepID=A0A6J5KI13_9CAUD|nr:hypothetical protein UFOVP2_14 [uncultured Caudovirales phage]
MTDPDNEDRFRKEQMDTLFTWVTTLAIFLLFLAVILSISL